MKREFTIAGYEIITIPIENLVPHEGLIEKHVKKLLNEIKNDDFLKRPLAVSRLDKFGYKGKFLIHDGHHRTESLKRLGCKSVKATIIDFSDEKIKVRKYYDWKVDFPKEKVIELALNALKGGKLLPRRDRTFIEVNGKLLKLQNNEMVEPARPTPLKELKRKAKTRQTSG
jgi:hypothetical protein